MLSWGNILGIDSPVMPILMEHRLCGTQTVLSREICMASPSRLVIADLYSTARSVEATASPRVGGIQLRPSRAAGRCLPDGGLWLP